MKSFFSLGDGKNYLAVAAAAFLSCLTACRRISPESGREEKLRKMKIIRQESKRDSRKEEKNRDNSEGLTLESSVKMTPGISSSGRPPHPEQCTALPKITIVKTRFYIRCPWKVACGLCAFLKVAVWADHLKGLPVVDVNLADLQ